MSGPPTSRRKRRRPSQWKHCRDCRVPRDPQLENRYWKGLCETCRDKRARLRRAETGARLLQKAKPAGTETRNGQTFTIVQLPDKRRGGSRLR